MKYVHFILLFAGYCGNKKKSKAFLLEHGKHLWILVAWLLASIDIRLIVFIL